MTALLFLNGKRVGSVAFGPDGTPTILGDPWSVFSRLPITVFPFLDPKQFRRTLLGLPKDLTIPGLGVLHIEVLQ